MQNELTPKPIEAKLEVGNAILVVVGFVSAIVTIYLATKWTFLYALLLFLIVAIGVLSLLLFQSLKQQKKITKEYNELLQKYTDLHQRHQAVSSRFDNKTRIVERNKDFREYIKSFLVSAISIPTKEEKQQLRQLIELVTTLESRIDGDD